MQSCLIYVLSIPRLSCISTMAMKLESTFLALPHDAVSGVIEPGTYFPCSQRMPSETTFPPIIFEKVVKLHFWGKGEFTFLWVFLSLQIQMQIRAPFFLPPPCPHTTVQLSLIIIIFKFHVVGSRARTLQSIRLASKMKR